MAAELHSLRPAAQALEGSHAVNGGHEIELQRVLVPHETIQTRRRVERLQEHSSQAGRDGLQLLQICRGLSKQEVDIDGSDRSTLQRSRSVPDHDRLQAVLVERTRHHEEDWLTVHVTTSWIWRSFAHSGPSRSSRS